MTVINLNARERHEAELACLSNELRDRAEQGHASAAVVAQLARRICDTAEALART